MKVALTEDRQMREIKFEVPVFKTPASSPNYVDDESVLEPYLAQPDAERVLQRRSFTDEPVPGGRRLTFGLFSWWLVLGLLVLCGLCGAGTVAIARYVPLPPSLFAGLIPAVLTLIGVYCLAEVLLWGSAVTIMEDRIELEGGWLGFRRRAMSERDRPPRLVAREQFKKENGAWWSVEARPADGPPTARRSHSSSGSTASRKRPRSGPGSRRSSRPARRIRPRKAIAGHEHLRRMHRRLECPVRGGGPRRVLGACHRAVSGDVRSLP